jgi:hypothetical protein
LKYARTYSGSIRVILNFILTAISEISEIPACRSPAAKAFGDGPQAGVI